MCPIPLMNYPSMIDVLLETAAQMKQTYEKEVDEKTRKQLSGDEYYV